jgi:hypothetical protein
MPEMHKELNLSPSTLLRHVERPPDTSQEPPRKEQAGPRALPLKEKSKAHSNNFRDPSIVKTEEQAASNFQLPDTASFC